MTELTYITQSSIDQESVYRKLATKLPIFQAKNQYTLKVVKKIKKFIL